MARPYNIARDVLAGSNDIRDAEWREAIADQYEIDPNIVEILDDYSTAPFFWEETSDGYPVYMVHDLAWRMR